MMDWNKLTVPVLKEECKNRNIDLKGLTRKAQFIEKLEEYEATAQADNKDAEEVAVPEKSQEEPMKTEANGETQEQTNGPSLNGGGDASVEKTETLEVAEQDDSRMQDALEAESAPAPNVDATIPVTISSGTQLKKGDDLFGETVSKVEGRSASSGDTARRSQPTRARLYRAQSTRFGHHGDQS